MSWAAIKAAMETPMTDPTAKLVLLAVAYRVGTDGRAWPSIATIAANTGLAHSTVRKAIDRLVKAHRLEVIHRPGRSSVLRYQVADTPLTGDNYPATRYRTIEHVKEPVKERGGAQARHFLPGSGWIEDFGRNGK